MKTKIKKRGTRRNRQQAKQQDLALNMSLRHKIGQYMVEAPELAVMRLKTLFQSLPCEVKALLIDGLVTVNLVSDEGLIFPVVMVAHEARSPFKEANNLNLLEKLVYVTYHHMGIAHVVAKDNWGVIRAGYSPITNQYTLWSC